MNERGHRLLSELNDLAEGELDTFLAEFPHPVLLIGPGAFAGRLDENTGTGADELSTGTITQGIVPSAEPTVVIPVSKRFTTTVADIIWIGRAVTCDVILAYDTVSKVHAVLSHSPSGDLLVTDVGSKNGTWLNKRRLESGQQMQMRDRDILRLGNVEARFLDPESLYHFLRPDAP